MTKAFKSAWPYLRKYKRGVLLGLGALILKDIAGAGIPLLVRSGIDAVTNKQPLSTLYWFCLGLVGVSLFKGLFQYWMRVILVGISRDVEYDMRNDIFRNLVRLNHDFYSRYRTGDVMARATNDLNAVRMMLGPAVMYWAETSLTFILALSIMFTVDWQLTLWALTPAPVVSVVVMVFGKRIHDRFEAIQELFSDISSRVQENLAGVRVIRAYVQEDAEIARFEELNKRFIAQNLKLATLSGLFMPLLQALIGLTFMLVLGVGGLRLMQGKISLGSFVMFNTFMGMLVWPMIAFGWVVNLMQRGKASMSRIQEYLQQEPSITAPAHPKAMPETADIEFQAAGLSFEGRAVLDGLALQIPAGQTIAIVGRTGSGKSSLVQLIPRIYDVTSGAVLIGGVDVRELDPADLRRQIGFVPQETFLFSSTIAENIAFGVESATDEEVREAAAIAGLAHDIEEFPDGFQTKVGERGITLSGGQKQRTAIARALLRKPKILILDDALSAVDTITEERILHGLRNQSGSRTTILISHRVSTVRDADCIYVLDEGRVVERGTHAELIATGGYYAELHQKQLLEEELEQI
ncbi:ABC transporter ATP-binding protein [Paludibaculum fermentans]|uniref:Multidrug resistance-like ATP-binding protein MdlA n=1 Tax=Paludibaculum fermentans TaxID=1473598 RepID=A0A7S7NWB4_PALFE|nr:ABC transporter ATP-binding protein [Paludibaculum fermentans]QOY90993.1 ABC transporter ATP-binding protein [Paludibaculum fermentans]